MYNHLMSNLIVMLLKLKVTMNYHMEKNLLQLILFRLINELMIVLFKNKIDFHEIEGILYKKYPEYKKKENYFTFNGSKIERWDTLEENGIIGCTIILNTIDNK